jgi:hypothetical protein
MFMVSASATMLDLDTLQPDALKTIICRAQCIRTCPLQITARIAAAH